MVVEQTSSGGHDSSSGHTEAAGDEDSYIGVVVSGTGVSLARVVVTNKAGFSLRYSRNVQDKEINNCAFGSI